MAHCKEMSQDILNNMETNTNVKDIYSIITIDIDQLLISDDMKKN